MTSSYENVLILISEQIENVNCVLLKVKYL